MKLLVDFGPQLCIVEPLVHSQCKLSELLGRLVVTPFGTHRDGMGNITVGGLLRVAVGE